MSEEERPIRRGAWECGTRKRCVQVFANELELELEQSGQLLDRRGLCARLRLRLKDSGAVHRDSPGLGCAERETGPEYHDSVVCFFQFAAADVALLVHQSTARYLRLTVVAAECSHMAVCGGSWESSISLCCSCQCQWLAFRLVVLASGRIVSLRGITSDGVRVLRVNRLGLFPRAVLTI